jgi:hypothetical protein
VVLTKNLTVGFQGRFSQIGSHKSGFAKEKTMICKSWFTGEKVHRASTGHETQFSSKFGAKLSLPCPFFS